MKKTKVVSKRSKIIMIFSILLAIILFINMILLALGRIKDILFWFIIFLAWVCSLIIKKYLQD